MKGKFVTFEGCEGVGKSTQVEMLKEYLTARGGNFLFLREPGGNAVSEKIRELILTKDYDEICGRCEALLYCAARAQLIDTVIRPALEQGKLVVCDRFTDSTFAYQGVARGLGAEYIARLNELTCGEVTPDVTVFLDMSPEEAFARKGGADASDRLESAGMEFHRKVYEGYREAARLYPDRIVSVDARPSADKVFAAVLAALERAGVKL